MPSRAKENRRTSKRKEGRRKEQTEVEKDTRGVKVMWMESVADEGIVKQHVGGQRVTCSLIMSHTPWVPGQLATVPNFTNRWLAFQRGQDKMRQNENRRRSERRENAQRAHEVKRENKRKLSDIVVREEARTEKKTSGEMGAQWTIYQDVGVIAARQQRGTGPIWTP